MNEKIYIILLLFLSINLMSKEWTIMIFLNGDNNLDEYAFVDFNELEKFGSTDNIDIVVQYDRANRNSDANWDTAKRFHITQDSDMDRINSLEISDLGEVDSGDYHSVVDFVRWSKNQYPADNYALIIWNHGDGWSKKRYTTNNNDILKKGISFDDQSDNYISVTRGDFENMLSSIKNILGKKIDFLGLDACSMAMWEVAYVTHTYVNYMAASEELEDATGWRYDTSLTAFNNDRTSINLCSEIVKNSIDSVGATLSCVNLNNFMPLNLALNNFATEFFLTHTIDAEMLLSSTLTTSFDPGTHKDLWGFVLNLKSRVSIDISNNFLDPIILALENYVVTNRTKGNNYSEAKGVAIYMPFHDEYDSNYSNGKWSIETNWDEFLQKSFKFSKDVYEPDNSFESATNNLEFTEQEHSIDNNNDEDYIKYNLKANFIYEFITESSNYDTMIYLYDYNKELLFSDDDGGENKASLIRYKSLEDQVVYLKVQTYEHNSVAIYNLKVKKISIEDDHPDKKEYVTENDKLFTREGIINYVGDIDFFYIDLEKDKNYIFETTEVIGGLDDTLLYLFDSEKLILKNDDIDKENKNYFSKIEFKVDKTDRYFIAIKAYEDNIGKYKININEFICENTNNGVETCDGIDNNCNFLIDENVFCVYPESNSSCIEGKCEILNCYRNFYDIDKNIENGCEYNCKKSNNSIEICDGIDNNCNGIIDEENTELCLRNNAKSSCKEHKCIIETCNENFYDINKSELDGCEYYCVKKENTKEICNDNLDNDCNGMIDENCTKKKDLCSFSNTNNKNIIFLLFVLSFIIILKRKFICNNSV